VLTTFCSTLCTADSIFSILRSGRTGRLTRESIMEVLPEPSADAFVLVCGPPAFNGLAAKLLTQLGYDEEMFHIFA
jgi:cytochrome-b5 reductase